MPCTNCLTIAICMQPDQRSRLPGRCSLAVDYVREYSFPVRGLAIGELEVRYSGLLMTELNEYLNKAYEGRL